MAEPGFPARTGRADFGPKKQDERKRRDPRSEFNAAQAELTFWQLGAFGLLAPLAVIMYDGFNDVEFESRFAWDGNIFTASNPYVAITKLGTGQYRFVFDANVPNQVGDLQTLTLHGAIANGYGITPTHSLANKRAEAEVVVASPGQVDVNMRDNDGPLADAATLLLVF